MKSLFSLCSILLLFACGSKKVDKDYRISHKNIDTLSASNFRGLSIAKDKSIWISGSKGTVLRSIDEGLHWDRFQIPHMDSIDFRDIEAFDAQHAITVSAGSPALIYETINGGVDWVLRYKNNDPKIFLDGMDFSSPKHGVIFGDPMNGRLTLLKTTDGGKSWSPIAPEKIPLALSIEAGFAASGTSIVYLKNDIWIGLGGEKSRIFYSSDSGNNWTTYNSPMLSGTPMQGIYSMSFRNSKQGIAVGGEWNAQPDKSHIYTTDGGKNWSLSTGVQAYRSGSCYVKEQLFIATGTGGTDISTNGGKTWKNISSEGWYSIAASEDGSLIVGSGKNGKVSLIELEAYDSENQSY